MPDQINTVENRTAPPPPTDAPPPPAPPPPESNPEAQAQNDIYRSLGLGKAVDEVV